MIRSLAVASILILLASLLPAAGLQGQEPPAPLRVPEGNGRPILIDGLFSPGEWDDAMVIQVRPDLQLLLKKTSEYVFLGLRYSPFTLSIVDLFLSADGTAVCQLHVSAQLGERLLTGSGPAAEPPGFVWGATSDWYANEIRWDAGRAEALKKEGKNLFEAQQAALFRCEGFEFQIRRSKFGPGAWLMRFETPMPVGEKVVFPAGTNPASTEGWLKLELDAPPAAGSGSLAPSAASQPVGEFVAGLYDLVSAPAGRLPDWDKVRACFLKEAVVVLRTSRTALTVFDLEGFIKDFVDFYERPFRRGQTTVVPKDLGFGEKVVRMKVWEYGDMAHVLVLYEAAITGFDRPSQGVDSWSLVRKDGRWFIAGITNEVVTAARPVPPELRDRR